MSSFLFFLGGGTVYRETLVIVRFVFVFVFTLTYSDFSPLLFLGSSSSRPQLGSWRIS